MQIHENIAISALRLQDVSTKLKSKNKPRKLYSDVRNEKNRLAYEREKKRFCY